MGGGGEQDGKVGGTLVHEPRGPLQRAGLLFSARERKERVISILA